MGTYQDLYKSLKNDPEALQEAIEGAVKINRAVVLEDLFRQAQVYMTWGYLLALADTDAKRLKLNMEEDVLPKARIGAVIELKAAGEKITIASKDDIAKQDPSYKQVQTMLITAQQRAAIYRKVVDALDHKRDMLQSLNSRQKVEIGSVPQEDNSWMGERPQDPESGRTITQVPLAPKNHEDEDVESQVANLAKTYRSKRRTKRNESE